MKYHVRVRKMVEEVIEIEAADEDLAVDLAIDLVLGVDRPESEGKSIFIQEEGVEVLDVWERRMIATAEEK